MLTYMLTCAALMSCRCVIEKVHVFPRVEIEGGGGDGDGADSEDEQTTTKGTGTRKRGQGRLQRVSKVRIGPPAYHCT
jgi:hypothetical protein